jgi:hypothetical protein
LSGLIKSNLSYISPNRILTGSSIFGIRLKIQLHPTEPANYTGSYTRLRKRIVDTEIAMHQDSRRTILISTMQVLSFLKLAISEEQEEGGLRT